MYSYLKIKNNFFKKVCKEGLISIMVHNLCVFALVLPLLKKSLKDEAVILHEALLR